MLPSFNANGKLPPGIHTCTWEEFLARFGTTPHRLNLIAGLKIAMTHLRAKGCPMVYVQMDRDGRRKGIISIDLVRWKP
jgi:hypothetical protein